MADVFSTVDKDALNLTRAIGLAESGKNGRPNYNASGKSGEHGAYQWMPGNFEAGAIEAGLDPSDFSSQAQDKVAYYQVKKFKDQGLQPWEIASKWNSGSPDNWKDHKGVNQYGVAYDTPAYVTKVKQHYVNMGGQQSQPITAEAPQEEGAFGGLEQKLTGRLQDIGDTFQQPNLARGVLRSVGAVAGGINDVVGATASALVPDFIEKPVMEGVGNFVSGIPGVKEAAQGYESLDPELKKDIGAVGNIASLVPVGRGIGLGTRAVGEVVPTATRAVASSGGLLGGMARKSLVNEALEIVSPKQTAKTIKAGIKSGRAEPGSFFGPGSIAQDARTMRSAEASAGIVKKGRTGIENANALRTEIGKTAEKLQSDLKAMEVTPIVQKEEMDSLLETALRDIGENPTMVGDAGRSAELILKKFQSFLPKGDVTAFDLLEARKKLDSWMDSQSVGNVFNPNYETAKTVALRSIRQGANELMAQKAPNVAVKESLARQSALYDALENVSAKAVPEATKSGLDLLMKKHPGISGLIKDLGRAGATGLGIGSIFNLTSKE